MIQRNKRNLQNTEKEAIQGRDGTYKTQRKKHLKGLWNFIGHKERESKWVIKLYRTQKKTVKGRNKTHRKKHFKEGTEHIGHIERNTLRE